MEGGLPGGFGDAGDIAVRGKFPEADAADAKEADVPVTPIAELAGVVDFGGELRLFARSFALEEDLQIIFLPVDEGGASHVSRVGSGGGKVGGLSGVRQALSIACWALRSGRKGTPICFRSALVCSSLWLVVVIWICRPNVFFTSSF